jgi:acyl-CoA synthetase (AMP-forming)/AMP-acid ligase II
MTVTRAGYGLFDALERVVDRRPDDVAVRCGASSWTFAELRDRVVRLANAWREAGIAPGDRVAVLADNCHRFVELYWACAYLGAVVVPLERRLGVEEVRTLLHEVQPAAVVAGHAEQLGGLVPLIDSPRLWVTLSDTAPPGAAGASTPPPGWSSAEAQMAASSDAAEPAHLDAGAPVAVFYTAAVEGRSRGAVVTHRNLLAQAVQTGEGLGLVPGEAQGLFLPLAHTFGAYLMFVATCRGVTNTILSSFDPVEAATLIDAGQVTFFAGFAPMPARIADAAAEAGLRLSGRLRLVMGLDGPATIERYLDLGVRWMNFYGQTETAGLVALGEVAPGAVDPAAVGSALLLCRLSLRDDAGRPVPAGEAGEAWVRSDVVVERYWPDEPTRLSADGWLRTGDVLSAGPGQALRFIGRTTDKDLVKPGGLNVYPAEVEALLAAHPGVARAFVFGLPDPEWRERVCAVVLPSDPADPPAVDALVEHCRRGAARFKCPRAILVVADGAADLTRVSARDRYRGQLEALEPTAAEGTGLVV